MPSRRDRFPHARPRRRPHARFGVVGAVLAIGILLIAPASAPADPGLDAAVDLAQHAAAGQEPATPGASAAPLAALGTGTPAETAAPAAVAPVLAASPAPVAAAPAPTPTADTGIVMPGRNPGRTPDWLIAERRGQVAPAVESRPSYRGGEEAPAVESLTGYRWPLAHPRLTLPFGPTPWGSRLVNGERFHDGIDMATFCGDRVMAAHAGTVLAAGRHFDDVMGWVGDLRPYYARLDAKHLWFELPIVVVIDDGNGYRSMYAHFGRIAVAKGDVVRAGQLLGYEGATGRASGCHLHYGLFSPLERSTFSMVPDVAKRMRLPDLEIRRIDPRLVLGPKPPVHKPTPSPAP